MSDRRRILVLAILNLGYAWLLISFAVASKVPPPSSEVAAALFPDKLAHALAYAGEAILLYWMLSSLVQPLAATLIAWLGTAALGMLTEVIQEFHQGRSADPGDLLADMLGATVVVFTATLVRRAIPATRVAWR